jgi:hypothetical protein
MIEDILSVNAAASLVSPTDDHSNSITDDHSNSIKEVVGWIPGNATIVVIQ